MTKINLTSLSLNELLSLQEEVETIILERKEMERERLIKQVEALVIEAGLSLDELFQDHLSTQKAQKEGHRKLVAPKYANPEDPSETWTGRGRKPKWVEMILERGCTLEEVVIPTQTGE